MDSIIARDDASVVTGAFGFTGKYIARRLLAMGKKVKTLISHPNRPNPFGDQVSVALLNFDDPRELTRSLEGATTLYNTYWVRFPRGQVTFEKAIENTKTLIEAAENAGVRRIVHISVANPSEDLPLPYFRGKAHVEQAVTQSKLSYAIVRPTLIFGTEDILINNMAWLLRRFPLFAIAGRGDYRVQPVSVEDVAEIAIHAAQKTENMIVDAAGPDVYTFDELVRLIAEKIHSRAMIVHTSVGLALFFSKLIGYAVNDVMLTRGEVEGLMANLLVSRYPPTGKARLSDWLDQNASSVGIQYASELGRHFR